MANYNEAEIAAWQERQIVETQVDWCHLVDMARPKGRRMRTVTVTAGPYATVRAVEEARRLFGPTVTVAGIIGPNWLNRYTYEVIDIDDLVEDEL